jgi:hypothetical protein
MECGGPVKFWRACLTAGLFWCGLASAAPADDTVVLIVSADSAITHLDSLAVRKLFLGFSVAFDGHALRGLRNVSDKRLGSVFLQNIVSMSETAYERRLLTLALQQGQLRPLEFFKSSELLAVVAADRNAVSYALLSEVEGNKNIRVLRVIWHE